MEFPVLACGDRKVRFRSQYSGTRTLRLRWPPHRLVAVAAIFGALAAAGCSFPLESMFPKGAADTEQTGSAGRPAGEGAIAALPSEADLAYARAVAADALTRGAKDNSIPWENPHTGAGGSITPLAASYSEGATTCRDFLASYVRGQAQAWLQGEACRTAHGKWEVRSLRPFKQS